MDHLGVNSLRLSKCHKYFENHFKVDFESVSSVKENLENGQVNNSPNPFLKYFPTLYRLTHLLADLGWVDLDLGCSTGRWAVLQLRCCPSKTVEPPKSKSTQPSPRGDGSPYSILAM